MIDGRDVHREIAAATRAGDVDTLSALAMELASIVKADADRREKQRRKTNTKRQKQGDNRGQQGTTGDTEGQSETAGDPPSPSLSLFSPTPPINPFPTPSPASPSSAQKNVGNVENSSPLDGVPGFLELESALSTGDDRVALGAVLVNCPNAVAWVAEMGASLQGMHGPQLTPKDLGAVLRDYVGNGHHRAPSFKHFRAYLRNPDRDKGAGGDASPETGKTLPGPGPDLAPAAAVLGQIRELVESTDTTRHGRKQFIRADRVRALGEDVFAAYTAIGGADRILGCEADKLGFLQRDFAEALKFARRPRRATG